MNNIKVIIFSIINKKRNLMNIIEAFISSIIYKRNFLSIIMWYQAEKLHKKTTSVQIVVMHILVNGNYPARQWTGRIASYLHQNYLQ